MRARILMPLIIPCALALTGPAPATAQQELVPTLSRIEKTLWQAWKDHDSAPFQQYLVDNAVNIGVDGIEAGKARFISALKNNGCSVQGFGFSDWAVEAVTSDVAVLTYRASQDGECKGQTLPSRVIASSVYVRRGGLWMVAVHHETPAAM